MAAQIRGEEGGPASVGEFPWGLVLPLLSRNKTVCRGILGTDVATQGSGPYAESAFDGFLNECGIEVRHVSGGELPPNVVILGRENWDEDDIDELSERTAGNVQVYSQEMVIASMAIGTDIFELWYSPHTDIDMDFIDGHPALERFYWGMPRQPMATSDDPVETLHIDFDADASRPALGVLKDMGYRAGQNGLLPNQRREILRRVLLVKLVATSPWTAEYIREWGEPGTYRRLNKMRRVLAGLAKTARRKTSVDMSEAIDDWESDLGWLSETYGDQ